MDQGNKGEFHKADPRARSRMRWLLGLTVLVGVALLAGLQWWLSQLFGHPSTDFGAAQRALGRVLAALCFGFALVAFAFAAWLFRLAAATRAERRWPPSSMRTSSDVRIRYLTSADALVTQMRAGAFGLAVVALGLAAWGAWLLRAD